VLQYIFIFLQESQQRQQQTQVLRQIQAFHPEGQLLWVEGDLGRILSPTWLVSGSMPQIQRRLPWVIGRLRIIDRARPQVPDNGSILLVETPIPAVDGEMWIVQGEASNVRRLIRATNFDHLRTSSSPLRLIGQFEGGQQQQGEVDVPAHQVQEPVEPSKLESVFDFFNAPKIFKNLILMAGIAALGFFATFLF